MGLVEGGHCGSSDASEQEHLEASDVKTRHALNWTFFIEIHVSHSKSSYKVDTITQSWLQGFLVCGK